MTNHLIKQCGAGKLAQQLKVLAAKPEDLSSTHRAEGEN